MTKNLLMTPPVLFGAARAASSSLPPLLRRGGMGWGVEPQIPSKEKSPHPARPSLRFGRSTLPANGREGRSAARQCPQRRRLVSAGMGGDG